MRREFLMLANKYKEQDVSGWYISEKLDGTRAFWDGGNTRDKPTIEVSYANIYNPKTGELKKKIRPTATGLWSRYGNPIMAPDWFLNQLPDVPLDGELWCGRGEFQKCRSIVSRDTPDDRWHEVKFAVFGSPPMQAVLQPGNINCPNFRREIEESSIQENSLPIGATFEQELSFLQNAIYSEGTAYLHPHKRIFSPEQIEEELIRVLLAKGEGIMLRDPNSTWTPKRVSTLLKYKPFSDAEATITGFTSGRETERGSKLKGLIGALITDYRGKRLELSGLTHEERKFSTSEFTSYAETFPGQDMPPNFQGVYFKLGDTVTFKYRELSDEGVPKEARYWRTR